MGFLEEDIQSGVPSAHWMLSFKNLRRLKYVLAQSMAACGSRTSMSCLCLGKAGREREKENSENKLGFQDSTFVELALRVLGLMCDGQNRTLQVNCKKKLSTIFTIVMKQVEISSLILA